MQLGGYLDGLINDREMVVQLMLSLPGAAR